MLDWKLLSTQNRLPHLLLFAKRHGQNSFQTVLVEKICHRYILPSGCFKSLAVVHGSFQRCTLFFYVIKINLTWQLHRCLDPEQLWVSIRYPAMKLSSKFCETLPQAAEEYGETPVYLKIYSLIIHLQTITEIRSSLWLIWYNSWLYLNNRLLTCFLWSLV